LGAKGVAREIVGRVLAETDRTDQQELQKVIAKKQNRYPDKQKFMGYLLRQGFSYEDIQAALEEYS
jgi:SOS response regulatory protein OraA/RecX